MIALLESLGNFAHPDATGVPDGWRCWVTVLALVLLAWWLYSDVSAADAAKD